MEPINTIMLASMAAHLVAERIPKSILKTKLAREIRLIVSILFLCTSIVLAGIIVLSN